VRIFLAGGTGAIGRPLTAALVTAGYEVTVFSRQARRVAALGVPGVVPAVGDALDADVLRRAVLAARPDVVVNQLTSLPVGQSVRGEARLRRHQPARA
jgi:nucleoside-diphosphate-sugar epimerase